MSKDGLTALDHLTRRDVTGGGLSQQQKSDMAKLIKITEVKMFIADEFLH